MIDIIRTLPLLLVLSRFLIAILFFVFSNKKSFEKYFFPLFMFGFFADFLDGFICRRLGGVPAIVGLLDGYADTSLYLATFYFLWNARNSVVRKYRYAIAGLIGLMLISWLFSFVKFGKLTSYHGYTAKLWGISIFLAVTQAFIFRKNFLLPLMIVCGLINNLDEMATTYLMPYYKTGISSFKMAVRLADDYRANSKPAAKAGGSVATVK